MEAEDKPRRLFILRITIVATIGGFLFGFDSGVINGTVDGLQRAFDSNSMGTGFNVASMLLGCAAGAFAGGRLADRFGRRGMLFVAAAFFIISAWGSGISNSSLEFIFYRIIGGMAVGTASVLAPAYISEIAPHERRGSLSSLQQIAIITGLFTAFLSNYLLVRLSGGAVAEAWLGYETWRWMFWVELVPACIFFFALLTIPESPRYLVARGKKDRAEAVFGQLGNPEPKEKVAAVEASLVRDHQPRFSDIFINGVPPRLRPIILVGIALAAFQQLVGINVVFYYGAVLWQSAGFTEEHALLINVFSGFISIGACAVATLRIDIWGRKPLLLAGSVAMAVCLTAMSVVFLGADVDPSGRLSLGQTEGRIALVAANLYVFFFNLSWGPVMWVLLGEMFPNQVRGSGLAVSGLSQWLCNFAITMSFPIILVSLGLGVAYGMYAAFAIISIWFVIAFVRETKGLQLEEMEG